MYPFAFGQYSEYTTPTLSRAGLPMSSTRDMRQFRPVATGHFCRRHQSYAAQAKYICVLRATASSRAKARSVREWLGCLSA